MSFDEEIRDLTMSKMNSHGWKKREGGGSKLLPFLFILRFVGSLPNDSPNFPLFLGERLGPRDAVLLFLAHSLLCFLNLLLPFFPFPITQIRCGFPRGGASIETGYQSPNRVFDQTCEHDVGE